MVRLAIAFCVLAQYAASQVQPASHVILGDTASHVFVNDFFTDHDGTVYSTGYFVKDSFGLYISAVTAEQQKKFELIRIYGFDEKGYFIRPYDDDHIIVCGHSEDTTGTFNVRLLMLTKSGTVVWDTTFGNNGESTMEMPKDLAFDSKGNILVAGISHSSEVKYLLLKFSPSGEKLWSLQSKPFEAGTFYLHDILIDANDNIYGVTQNSFVADTSHCSIVKWDASGGILWHREYNLSFPEERGRNLLFSGDTLFVLGTPWIEGLALTSLAIVSVRSNGDLVSYAKLPFHSSLLGVEDARLLGNTIAVVAESFSDVTYRLHTLFINKNLSIAFHDSLVTSSTISGAIVADTDTSCEIIRYGAALSLRPYHIHHSSVVAGWETEYSTIGQFVDFVDYQSPNVYAIDRLSDSKSDRVRITTFPAATTTIVHQSSRAAVSFDVFPAYPNPFNPATTITIRMALSSFVSIKIFDLAGREVAVILSRWLDAGTYEQRWDAGSVSGGVYLCRIQAGDIFQTQKLVLLK